MSKTTFVLDPRLEADSRHVATLPLCELRLMNDARFAWLILVPHRAGMVEVTDLCDAEQQQLWREANLSAAALRAVAPCDKLNLGALGNIVRQLHLHVVARIQGDSAWPGPVWGSGAAVLYAADTLAARLDVLRQELKELKSVAMDGRPFDSRNQE